LLISANLVNWSLIVSIPRFSRPLDLVKLSAAKSIRSKARSKFSIPRSRESQVSKRRRGILVNAVNQLYRENETSVLEPRVTLYEKLIPLLLLPSASKNGSG
jgi:hypothetical protein